MVAVGFIAPITLLALHFRNGNKALQIRLGTFGVGNELGLV